MAVADQDMEIMEEEGPDGSSFGDEDINSGAESHKNPWPNLEDLFAFKRTKGNNIIMQCKMCLPGRTELSAFKTSTSNLRKHVVSESNTHLGWLLPVISELQSKLRRQEASVKMCLPLISALQQGVQRRFRVMMEDRELISAAILLPKFKTGWTDKAEVTEAGLLYVRHHLDQMAEAEVKQGALKEHSSDEEDYFSTMKSRRSEGSGELEGYLACVSESMDLLNSFPNIKKLSLKLNTGLPASAACERLFSSAGLLFTAKRARLTAKNFENQLLLKLNKSFSSLKL